MLKIKKMTQPNELSDLKTAYFNASTGPLDGMWHFGFAPMAQHFGFYESEVLVGFCCINSEKYLLQFYLSEIANTLPSELFTLIINNESKTVGEVKGAFASTAEPQYLSLCMDGSTAHSVNALMYQHCEDKIVREAEEIELILASYDQLNSLVDFAFEAIDAPKEWLTSYYTRLISRDELWYWAINGSIVATGECRLFDEHQTQFADLGMIVSTEHRRQGIATRVLEQLVMIAKRKGLNAICSTESGNIGAQKAIHKAGFKALNRIVQFDFSHR
ncbi:GNAT family N-acetyltransferase [Pseudoalteromonas luteoviolacea]|uniref:GNAT family N-acetyltransferase n=1 Tax=Pseudoalteromonas luteoviolacea TaxID=43657 RepID=UPI001B36F40B|nr:GNAT family N-acetyltransferase [Pseudoalteromonas luteoviolacea]MBQ4837860.1 GNAT family N-acetyltransferase [Pseudoalteromonas luteoviolacea]